MVATYKVISSRWCRDLVNKHSTNLAKKKVKKQCDNVATARI